MSETQDLYQDSDLVPLSDLFGEMGGDRSIWRRINGGLLGAHREVEIDLEKIGLKKKQFDNTPENVYFIELTSIRRKEIDNLKDEKNRTLVLEKIFQSGLIDLAEMAGGIREFARLRFQDAASLRKSAADFNDPIRDTLWLNKLIEVKDYFHNDPLMLATVYKYFPNLYNLFITALSATADYGYSEEDPLNNHEQIVENLFKSFGTNSEGKSVFEPAWAIENFTTAQKIEKAIKETSFWSKTPPVSPDVFHLRIGASNFYVPPVTIAVNTGFKTASLTGGAIRQKSSPKFNSGHRETTINLKLYFPNYEEIWGISIDDAAKVNLSSNYYIDYKETGAEQKLDKFLSSLRGLIAAFKYAPILPIKNHYINSVYGITGVALTNMTVSTVPNYPFTLEVDLELASFNHKPYLPMIKDFNQAVHWGRFRYYMSRAAGSIANAVNAEFLLDTVTEKKAPITTTESAELPSGFTLYPDRSETITTQPYRDGVLTTNVMKEWIDGKNISLYIPSQVQSRIYSPDISSFRSEEEKAVQDYNRAFWEKQLYRFGIDKTDETLYRSLDTVVINSVMNFIPMNEKQKVAKILEIALAGANAENVYEAVYSRLVADYISTNKITNASSIDYLRNTKSPNELEVPALPGDQSQKLKDAKYEMYISSQSINGLLRNEIAKNTEAILKKKKILIDKNSKQWRDTYKVEEKKFMDAFTGALYENFYKDESIQNLLTIAAVNDADELSEIEGRKISAFNIREWEVPMMKVDLDERSVIVNSVSLTMGNNMAKLQLQMQEEPTFQYIGSKDTIISISMTVFGETELIKIRKMFDFLSGLARLEQAAGVIGFMGIKNVVCALAGVKYVLPLNYSVQTIEGFPHVYNVNLMLVDFDIFQQKRESISSEQQISIIKELGSKKNPFLRLKQRWGAFNAYPDLPLSIVDTKTKETVGTFDPDFYFRSFETFDDDVINNIIDPDNFTLPIEDPEAEQNGLSDRGKSLVHFVKAKLIDNNGNVEEIKDFLMNENKIPAEQAMKIFRIAIFDQLNPGTESGDTQEKEESAQVNKNIANKYPNIWKDFIESLKADDGVDYDFSDIEFNTRYGNVRIGDVISGSKRDIDRFNKLIADSVNQEIDTGMLPSFDPDDTDHFGIVYLVPAADPGSTNKIPAIYQTPDGGYLMGYSNSDDGRFYLAKEHIKFSSDGKITPIYKTNQISDTQTPERDPQDSHTGIPGAKSLDKYQHAYGSASTDRIESVSQGGSYKGVAKHWQKMMLDTQYRDIGGRMLRAYPTYMLWLIDDSNFFAGVKLFDNFYGLQSVIDFSIVQSEDILRRYFDVKSI